MNYFGFDEQISAVVSELRSQKLRRISQEPPPRRRKRKPRFCVTVSVSLCPRQREAKKKLGDK